MEVLSFKPYLGASRSCAHLEGNLDHFFIFNNRRTTGKQNTGKTIILGYCGEQLKVLVQCAFEATGNKYKVLLVFAFAVAIHATGCQKILD